MADSRAQLRIIQVTDIYTLLNFPKLKTLIKEKRNEVEATGGKCISMLTGDFLAPYLLSSLDKGVGMMSMLNQTPIDYLIWGNHEHDMLHADVMKREKEYKGVWINSNMQSHQSFKDSKCQVDHAVVSVESTDGTNNRKVGMIGVLSNTPSLYKPGAFGGATIEDPWECMASYTDKLMSEGCDMVLPLCHLYEFQDERTCAELDVPVVLSGHDHHRVDRMVEGTRLLKPGMDGHFAVILDLIWDTAESDKTPTVEAVTIPVADYEADSELESEMKRAYSVLDPLLKTDLATVPDKYFPLSSKGPRERRVTMATYLCSQLRVALNMDTENYPDHCDCVILKGGNIRGERDYSESRFTLEGLQSELQGEECLHIFKVPGRVLKGGLKESWTGPNPGWIQYCDAVEVDEKGNVSMIGGAPLDLKDIWRRILGWLDADGDGEISTAELAALDVDGDGKISKSELRAAMRLVLGLSTHGEQDTLLDLVMAVGGDKNGDGELTVEEINT